jgi:hypothetical protein
MLAFFKAIGDRFLTYTLNFFTLPDDTLGSKNTMPSSALARKANSFMIVWRQGKYINADKRTRQ